MAISFVIIFGLSSSVPEIALEPKRWNGCLGIHNKPHSTTPGFILMKWLLESTQGWGLVARGTNHGKRDGTFSPTPWFPGWGKELEVESIANGQWFDQSCLCKEASIKIQKKGFRGLPGWRKRTLPHATVLGPKLHEDRTSFVRVLALGISTSDYWFVSFNILCHKPAI